MHFPKHQALHKFAVFIQLYSNLHTSNFKSQAFKETMSVPVIQFQEQWGQSGLTRLLPTSVPLLMFQKAMQILEVLGV